MDSIWGGALAVLLIAALMVFQAMQGVLIRKKFFLPAVVYIVAVAGLVPLYGLSNILLAAVCFSLFFYSVDLSVIRQHSNAPVFAMGAFSFLVAFFVPKLVAFVPFGLLILALIGRFSVKDISALFIGWITALIFIFTWLFCNDLALVKWGEWCSVILYAPDYGIGNTGEWIRLAFLFILMLIMGVACVTKLMPQLYTERRFISVVIATPIIIGISAVLLRGVDHEMLYVSAIPIAWVASYFYQATKSIGAKVIFYAYLLLSLLPVFS